MTEPQAAALESSTLTVTGLRSVLSLEFPGVPVSTHEGLDGTFVSLSIWEFEIAISTSKTGGLFIFKRKFSTPTREHTHTIEQHPVKTWDEVHESLDYAKQHLNGIVAVIEMAMASRA